MSTHYYHQQTNYSIVPILINYFKSKEAISPDKAIPFGLKEQIELTGNPLVSKYLTSNWGYGLFIKKTSDNRFYLDENGIELYGKRSLKYGRYILFIVLSIFSIPVIVAVLALLGILR